MRAPSKAKQQFVHNLKHHRTRGEKVVDWIEANLIVPDGFLAGQPVQLLDFQKDFILRIYDNPHGTRRAIAPLPKKNGKTGLAACLLLVHLCGPEARRNGELYSSANSKEQAAITFKAASRMVAMSPNLNQHVLVRASYEIEYPPLGTIYKALASDKTTAQGLKPVFIIHDELGQVEDESSELYETLEKSMSTQADPLSIVISTQAPNDRALFSQLIDDAKAGHDPRVVLMIYEVPKKEPVLPTLGKFRTRWWRNIKAANPALGHFQNPRELWDSAKQAARMPAQEASFRNYHANQRIEAHSRWMPRGVWDECVGTVAKTFSGPVYIGIDLASTTDLTALVAVSSVDRKWHVHPYAWLPANNLFERAQVDHVPYDVWRQQGYLRTTPGDALDYADLAKDIVAIFATYPNIKAVAFDRKFWPFLEPRLRDAGLPQHQMDKFVEYQQRAKAMAPALRVVEEAVFNKKIVHANNPVLNWCVGNAVATSKDESYRYLEKSKSVGRIDLAVALVMAMGVSESNAVDYSKSQLISGW